MLNKSHITRYGNVFVFKIIKTITTMIGRVSQKYTWISTWLEFISMQSNCLSIIETTKNSQVIVSRGLVKKTFQRSLVLK